MNRKSKKKEILAKRSILDIRGDAPADAYVEPEAPGIAADPVVNYMSREELERLVKEPETKMAAKELDFITAAQYRNELFSLKKQLK